MRIIGTLSDGRQALEFSHFLADEGIENAIEPRDDHFEVWVIDEDRLDDALRLLGEFKASPSDPKYAIRTVQHEEEPATVNHRRTLFPGASRMGRVTIAILAIAAILYLLGTLDVMRKESPEPRGISIIGSPIYAWLLFDYPAAFQYYHQLSEEYGDQLENLPPAGQELLKKAQETPYWQGIYGETIERFRDKSKGWRYEGPLFEKIGQGQVWRIFSPALLHGGLLHIFFNAIWILILGNQVEARIGKLRYIAFCLLTAGLSNTAQYLMSGPLFFGLSGIVCALFGFIWMRQRMAPWEGYQLNRPTIIFISIYIVGMAILGLILFFTQLTGNGAFGVPIANTAHIVGALAGILLARFNTFALQESH